MHHIIRNMPSKHTVKTPSKPNTIVPIKWKKLDGNIDIPPARKPPRVYAEYPFDLMEVGDCIEINRTAGRVRQAIWFYLNRAKTKGVGTFVVRRVTKESCRVWRTA